MDTPTPAHAWLEVVFARLQQQWPTVDPTRLDDVALDLWNDERLRSMPPDKAGREWLMPVSEGFRHDRG